MTALMDKAAFVEANRRRYEELKAAGETAAPKALPPPTPRNGAPVAEVDIVQREIIPGGWYWTATVARGEALRILNSSGTPGVSLFFWSAADPSERYNSADTVKIQWTAELRKGRVLFSDMGRVLFSIVEDSCGAHDTIVGGSTPASNLRKYGDPSLRSTRENLILAASKHGLGQRDIAPVVTFFAPVTTDADGRLAWRDGVVTAGDFVDLRAEMDLIVAVSNCPHPIAPDTSFDPGPVDAIIHRLPAPEADDLCRTASAEAGRGFENNARQRRI
jgi:urea carboxylase-associated protein 2